MERSYIVVVMNDLTIDRRHWYMEASTAQAAVDAVKEKYDDFSGYSIINVFVESDEIWE